MTIDSTTTRSRSGAGRASTRPRPGPAPRCPPSWPAGCSPPRSAACRSRVVVASPDGHRQVLGQGGPTMTVHRPDEFFARLGRHGLIGFGEAYLTEAWDADDLAGFLTVLAADLPTLVPASLQKARALVVARPPRAQRSTTANSRSNIAHHYDLSNELFATFLDPTLSYSSALFDTPVREHGGHLVAIPPGGEAATEPLAEAQGRKFERLLDRIGRRRRHPAPRDRHRLGRARHPGRPARRRCPQRHPLDRAARPRPTAHRRCRRRRTGSRWSCATTAPSRSGRRTTPSCPSR